MTWILTVEIEANGNKVSTPVQNITIDSSVTWASIILQ